MYGKNFTSYSSVGNVREYSTRLVKLSYIIISYIVIKPNFIVQEKPI